MNYPNLPEKWSITIDSESSPLIRAWLKRDAGESFSNTYVNSVLGDCDIFDYPNRSTRIGFRKGYHGSFSHNMTIGYTLITLEQFKENVLGVSSQMEANIFN